MNDQIACFDAAGFRGIDIPTEYDSASSFLKAFLNDAPDQPSTLVDNITTEAKVVRVGSQLLPMTINDENLDNSWVCSPYNAIVTYPLEELRNIRFAPLRIVLAGLVHSIAPWLRFSRVNRVVCVNNWLLSTNLYGRISTESVRLLTDLLRTRFPGRAILWRSLNQRTNAQLLQSLRDVGYLLAPSRQVYCYDGANPAYLRRHNTRLDLKLLDRSPGYTLCSHESFAPSDDARIRELYDLLYLRKYSRHNPQFTEKLIGIWRESGLINLFGLKGPSGQLEAVVGTLTQHGVMTVPLVGYNTTLPQSHGLYRMLMAHILRTTAEQKVMLNLSAGAAGFKRLRGGEPSIEYSAVYCRHLSLRQRCVWRALSLLLEHVGARVLRQFEL